MPETTLRKKGHATHQFTIMKDAYDVIRVLHKGAEGETRLCCTNDGAEVVVKVINQDNAHMRVIENQTEVARTLKNEGIIAITDVYVENGLCYIVMEKAEKDLRDLMEEQKDVAIDESEMKKMFRPVFKALKEMHEQGYVHGDIKPENLLVMADGRLKVADFGHTEKLRNGASTLKCGSPFYLAPELIKKRPHNEKIDVYALGVTMYYYVTKRLPYACDDYYTYCCSACFSDADLAPLKAANISNALIDIIKGMLARVPNARLSIQDCLNHKWFC